MLKKFKPNTPGTRGLILSKPENLTTQGEVTGKKLRANRTVKPCKSLMQVIKKKGGRDNNGHITCRHKGGGHKRFYRIIDFKRNKDDVTAKVASIEYDPNRSALIALLFYADGEKRYIIAPKGLSRGDTVVSGATVPYRVGCCTPMKSIPLGTVVHNIELIAGKGAKLVRSAGMGAQVMAKANGNITLKMPSGEVRIVNEACRATIGVVSNEEYSLRSLGKAGRTRWMGIRPTVRGTAMNPVDHPHGGGEGKHNGFVPQTPWGVPTKGYRTRKKNKTNKLIVKDRRK